MNGINKHFKLPVIPCQITPLPNKAYADGLWINIVYKENKLEEQSNI